MADTKISALPASTTPLAGTEVLPIVQSSATKQVSVANLTAGRAISATQLTLTTGNLIVASGQGIDFSATSHPAGMTSELLADYEEGTFTPTIDFGGGTSGITYSQQVGTYTKTGRNVSFTIWIVLTSKGVSTGSLSINGLPYTSNINTSTTTYADSLGASVNALAMYVGASGTTIFPYKFALGALTRLTDADLTNSSNMMIAGNYSV
jgi:hypothetical protein